MLVTVNEVYWLNNFMLFDVKTYPKSVFLCREELNNLPNDILSSVSSCDYASDYIQRIKWDCCSWYTLFKDKIINSMKNESITCFHNTRLENPDIILNNGLIFSDNRYVSSIINSVNKVIDNRILRVKYVSRLRKEIERWEIGGENNRKNQVCFYFDKKAYKHYDKFLALYGGEFCERTYSQNDWENDEREELKKLLKLGKPYIVEFFIPFDILDDDKKGDLVDYIAEFWIYKFLKKDKDRSKKCRERDMCVNFEISPDNIISIHSINDSFNSVDYYTK
jgi:hypothetical protein